MKAKNSSEGMKLDFLVAERGQFDCYVIRVLSEKIFGARKPSDEILSLDLHC